MPPHQCAVGPLVSGKLIAYKQHKQQRKKTGAHRGWGGYAHNVLSKALLHSLPDDPPARRPPPGRPGVSPLPFAPQCHRASPPSPDPSARAPCCDIDGQTHFYFDLPVL